MTREKMGMTQKEKLGKTTGVEFVIFGPCRRFGVQETHKA